MLNQDVDREAVLCQHIAPARTASLLLCQEDQPNTNLPSIFLFVSGLGPGKTRCTTLPSNDPAIRPSLALPSFIA